MYMMVDHADEGEVAMIIFTCILMAMAVVLQILPSCLIVIDDCYCPSTGAQVMLLRNRSKMNHGSSG